MGLATFSVLQPGTWCIFPISVCTHTHTHTHVSKSPIPTSCVHLLSGSRGEERSRAWNQINLASNPIYSPKLANTKMLIPLCSPGVLPGLKGIILAQESCSRNVSFVPALSGSRESGPCLHTDACPLFVRLQAPVNSENAFGW